jgi:hypothetical protein
MTLSQRKILRQFRAGRMNTETTNWLSDVIAGLLCAAITVWALIEAIRFAGF